MTLRTSLVLFVAGLINIWLVLRMIAFAMCTAAGNGVCVVS